MSNRMILEMLQDLRVIVARNRDMLADYHEFAKAAIESSDPKIAARAEAILASHRRLNESNDKASDRVQAQVRMVSASPAPRRARPRKKKDWFDKMTDWLC
jgi:hypothetical protein